MKVLHLTPHLGGGVGKAHSALCGEASSDARHHYVLLEEPRDRRFVRQIEAAGATVEVCIDRRDVDRHVATADIVQVEWWNHPALYQLLSQPLPDARLIFWVHISGLNAPYYPSRLIEQAERFIFTSPCSLGWDGLAGLSESVRNRLAVIGSGFGFEPSPTELPAHQRQAVSYLGTVDFVKMHPDFFRIIDACGEDVRITLFGAFEPEGEPVRAWQAMQHPERVNFAGQTVDPRAVLEQTAIFFENALVEAMSVGAVPLVMANPAETAIIRDGENGVVARDPVDAAAKLSHLLQDRKRLQAMSTAAMQDAADLYTARRSANLFENLYGEVMTAPKATSDLASVIGREPRDWFLSTQFPDGQPTGPLRLSRNESLSKGSLDHFLSMFPDDKGLLSLL
jgi:hypothetical protein